MNERIYSLLLALCPADVRWEFGAEMTQVFVEDLEEHRRRCGFHGVARVWSRALADLCGAALREVIARRQFAAPLIAYGLVRLLWFAFGCLVNREVPSPGLILSFSLYGLISAMVAFAVVRVAEDNAPILLKLRPR